MVLVGTRPEVIKMAPVIQILKNTDDFELTLVNAGQHYDTELSAVMFDDLKLPSPDFNLNVGSGTHALQTSKVLVSVEDLISQTNPDIVLAQGDTNTVLATALAAVKTKTPFGHVEAGLRSFDRSMPEELNRIIADHCSELHFAPTSLAAVNLLHEGCNPLSIHITGNTIVDVVHQYKEKANIISNITNELDLEDSVYSVATIHRPSNVDKVENLNSILSALIQLPNLKHVIPVHPRTYLALKKGKLLKKLQKTPNLVLTKPLSYFDFLKLLTNASLILTDSGGIQEEAFTLGKACITLRSNTERPESIKLGANYLVGCSTNSILDAAHRILEDEELPDRIRRTPNPFGDGHASEKIVEAIQYFGTNNNSFDEPRMMKTGSCQRVLKTVDSKTNGMKIQDIERKFGGLIQLVYDPRGHPIVPEPDRILHTKERFLFCKKE
jgi:UDP-N-acetylglucosamine 2-epimerase (non-hydrolysing)